MKQKRIALLMASLMATSTVVTVAGCSGEVIDNTSNDPRASITVATWDGGVGYAWLEQAAREFEEIYKDSTNFEEGKVGVVINVDADRKYTGTGIENTTLDKDIYFTEGINYYRLLNTGKIADLTSIMTTPLEDGTKIIDKVEDNYAEFLKTDDGKYYAIPFYDSFYSFAYDKTLWAQKGYYFDAFGEFTKDTSILGLGPDGMTGVVDGIDYTMDDGLPETYAQFNRLLEKMRRDSVTPFVWSEAGQEYLANYLYTHWASNEGYEQMMLNINFEGTANSLVNVAADGTVTNLPEEEISFKNGYMLQKQNGKYDALRFMGEILCATAENYEKRTNHIDAQSAFVKNGIEHDKPIGMIVEGSWWENEAEGAFKSLSNNDKQRHDYGILPTPRVDENSPTGQRTWLSLSSSYGFVSSSSKNKDLALEFMRYLHTDKQLSAFTAETHMTRALEYDVLEQDQAALTTYAKSIIDIKKNGKVIYPYSSLANVVNNDAMFTAYTWAWQTEIEGKDYKNPFLYFNQVDGASAVSYFNGLYTNFSSKWKDEWKK